MEHRPIVVTLVLVSLGCAPDDTLEVYVHPATPPDTGDDGSTTVSDDADPPRVEVASSTLDYDTVGIGCTADLPLELDNPGGSMLHLHSFSVEGPAAEDFWTHQDELTVGAGSATSFPIVFAPTETGPRAAVLKIETNDPASPLVEVELPGEAIGPERITVQSVVALHDTVDLLLVVSTTRSSPSVRTALDGLAEVLAAMDDLGVDWQVGVVSGDDTDPSTLGHLVGPLVSSGTPDAFATILGQAEAAETTSPNHAALEASLAPVTAPAIDDTNAGLLRPGAALSVVVLAGEDDRSSESPAHYATGLLAAPGAPDVVQISGWYAAWTTCPRLEEAAHTTDGRVVEELDTAPRASLRVPIQGNVDALHLERQPNELGSMEVWIDGEEVPQDVFHGWTSDPLEGLVRFHGDHVTWEDRVIDLSYMARAPCPD